MLAPMLLEVLGAHLQERRWPIAAGVVHGERERRESLRGGDEVGDVLRPRRVSDDALDLRAGRLQRRHGGGELLGVAPGDGDRKAAGRKPPPPSPNWPAAG